MLHRNTPLQRKDAMNGETLLDDRFDRRELLLHLGDMLEALSCLAKTGHSAHASRVASSCGQKNCSIWNSTGMRWRQPFSRPL